eukprot:jgi/Ulvmu1/9716/UM055_0054.1
MMYARTASRDGRHVDSSRRRGRRMSLAECSLSPFSEVFLSIVLVAALAGAAILILPKGTSVADASALPTPTPTPTTSTPRSTFRAADHDAAARLPPSTVDAGAVSNVLARDAAEGAVGLRSEAGAAEEAGLHAGDDAGQRAQRAGEAGGVRTVGGFIGGLMRQVGSRGHGGEHDAAAHAAAALATPALPSPLSCLHAATFVVNGTAGDCGHFLQRDAAFGAEARDAAGKAVWDTLTIESPLCAAHVDDRAAARWAASYSMHVRRGSTDLVEVQQALCSGDLDVMESLRAHMLPATRAGVPPAVLVIGARTGVVPLLLAHLFHFHVRVTALEPHHDRFAVAEANLRPLADGGVVACMHALLATEAAAGAGGAASATLASSVAGGAQQASVVLGGLAERLRGVASLAESVPAVSLAALQARAEGGRFDLVVLGASGMQLGVLAEEGVRSVLCAAACIVVEVWGTGGAHSGMDQEYRKVLEACTGPDALVEVERAGDFAIACRLHAPMRPGQPAPQG